MMFTNVLAMADWLGIAGLVFVVALGFLAQWMNGRAGAKKVFGGFVYRSCPSCGETFKLNALGMYDDLADDGKTLVCPKCGRKCRH